MIIDTDCVVIVKVRCSLVTKIFIARIFGRRPEKKRREKYQTRMKRKSGANKVQR